MPDISGSEQSIQREEEAEAIIYHIMSYYLEGITFTYATFYQVPRR